jgi:DNA mismatch repair protein MutS
LIDDLPLFAVTSRASDNEQAPSPEASALIEALNAIQPDELTPREALDALYALKAKLTS